MKKLVDLIINQYEKNNNWNNVTDGNSSYRIEEKAYEVCGKTTLIKDAKELEQLKLLTIKWVGGYYNKDIEKVEYPLMHMDEFCKIANRVPKYIIVREQMDIATRFYNEINSTWIREYIKYEILDQLEKGKYIKDTDKQMKIFYCLSGLDIIDSPILKRVFSKRYLKNSKIFENELEKTIIKIAKKYNQAIDEDMEDSDILKQLYIEEYSQELNLKGSLLLELDGITIDTGCFCYGTVLNTQTLKNATILNNQTIKKIVTIENKANFVSAPFEDGTLYLFSHGYFSPIERIFLIQLKDKLVDCNIEYFHNGDLDYGGIRIFQFIRKRIFPDIKPLKMDVKTFDQYIEFGEEIESSTLEKLKKIEEPLLNDLKQKIIETKLVIEQEAYL